MKQPLYGIAAFIMALFLTLASSPACAGRLEKDPGTARLAGTELKRPAALPVKAVNKPVLKPDLVVSSIRLTRDCHVQVTIQNRGPGGVPDLAYDNTKGVVIQATAMGNGWGGYRLFMVDKQKLLQKPGASMTYAGFKKTLNPGEKLTLKVEILDPGKVMDESNERNNAMTALLVCPQMPRALPKALSSRKTGTPALQPDRIKPAVKKMGNQIFLTFPQEVRNVTIADMKGKFLGSLGAGAQFNISKNLAKTKTKKIRVTFSPLHSDTQTPVRATVDISQFGLDSRVVMPAGEKPYRQSTHLPGDITNPFGPKDSTTIENSEPTNNSLAGAVQVQSGAYGGEVGSSTDPADYIKIASGSVGIGTLVSVSVYSGNADLTLFDQYMNSKSTYYGRNKNVWIALPINTTCYAAVQPIGSGQTSYSISVQTRDIVDAAEPNDSWYEPGPTPISFGTVNGRLAKVWGASSPWGHIDFYSVYIGAPIRLRARVTGAGLSSTGRVRVQLFSPNVSSAIACAPGQYGACDAIGDSNYATLHVDLRDIFTTGNFPAGNWRIEVLTQYNAPNVNAYGVGAPPANYTNAGYQLEVTQLQ